MKNILTNLLILSVVFLPVCTPAESDGFLSPKSSVKSLEDLKDPSSKPEARTPVSADTFFAGLEKAIFLPRVPHVGPWIQEKARILQNRAGAQTLAKHKWPFLTASVLFFLGTGLPHPILMGYLSSMTLFHLVMNFFFDDPQNIARGTGFFVSVIIAGLLLFLCIPPDFWIGLVLTKVQWGGIQTAVMFLFAEWGSKWIEQSQFARLPEGVWNALANLTFETDESRFNKTLNAFQKHLKSSGLGIDITLLMHLQSLAVRAERLKNSDYLSPENRKILDPIQGNLEKLLGALRIHSPGDESASEAFRICFGFLPIQEVVSERNEFLSEVENTLDEWVSQSVTTQSLIGAARNIRKKGVHVFVLEELFPPYPFIFRLRDSAVLLETFRSATPRFRQDIVRIGADSNTAVWTSLILTGFLPGRVPAVSGNEKIKLQKEILRVLPSVRSPLCAQVLNSLLSPKPPAGPDPVSQVRQAA